MLLVDMIKSNKQELYEYYKKYFFLIFFQAQLKIISKKYFIIHFQKNFW